MSTRSLTRSLALALTGSLSLAGCFGVIGGGDDGGDGPPPIQPPPPVEVPQPRAAIYKRGSIGPTYRLTPRSEYGRIQADGRQLADADFTEAGGNFLSASSKLDQISAQITAERGAPVNIIELADDRFRANNIPFRGNPSDVDVVTVGDDRFAVSPLGGDIMTPGNELAIVDLGDNSVDRVTVGVRPQRVALHPAGLAFVCNQYSNYISIVDITEGDLLIGTDGEPEEIATEYFCTDIILVPDNPLDAADTEFTLYVANQARGTVLEYKVEVELNGLNGDQVESVNRVNTFDPISTPDKEYADVGANPWRVSLSEDFRSILVANNAGGELAKIDRGSGAVSRVALGGVTADVVQVRDRLYVPTQMIDRGLPAREEAELLSPQVVSDSVEVSGQTVHPGAMFDETFAYNFEDVRNGLLQVPVSLSGTPIYYTDDISPEANYVDQQKVLTGAGPLAVVRNKAGTRIYVANESTDDVQELAVNGAGNFRVSSTGLTFQTQERPYQIALDEDNNQLLVATWGGERLQVFNLNNGGLIASIDLGYAALDYPATNIEHGEYLFYNADWANNGRKACAACHKRELLDDGIGYANGVAAATAYHQVTPNWNQMTTDSYFWTGVFADGNYTSLAFAAQSRTNCELVAFSLIEGMSSDPNQRIGDPANRITDGNDAACRPQPNNATGLPANFATIAQVTAAQKLVAEDLIEDVTGVERVEAAFRIDAYTMSELRLPPNPLAFLWQAGELDSETEAKLDEGEQLFSSQGCNGCHTAGQRSSRVWYTDNLNHGRGAGWAQQFVDLYANDARLLAKLPNGIPQAMLEGLVASSGRSEINYFQTPTDFFVPFCFSTDDCLTFDDPIAVRGSAEETNRLNKLIDVNLLDVDREFIPGSVVGQPVTNTPSLLGSFMKANLLRHGLAFTVAEAILPPAHGALKPGEKGWALNALGQSDVHGTVANLSADQVEALALFVLAIEVPE